MTKEIQLTQGKVALVDDEDFDDLNKYKWRFRSGYAVREVWLKGVIYMHRYVNKTPPGFDTDHIDCNKLNNQKANLRSCTKSENQLNRGKPVNNTSGYKGVSWDKQKNKWVASIQYQKKHVFIGYYLSPEEASIAYKNKAKLLFGDFAK